MKLFLRIDGHFFRAVGVDRIDHVLEPPDVTSAGRYHRLGQPTLYMSPSIEWSTMAISGYMREDGRERVIVPLMVSEAFVVDQRDEYACNILGIDRERSNQSWRPALLAGKEPASWINADIARNAGADGIIDRSRMIPDGWHLNLFRWNDLGGPSVTVCGEPIPISLSSDGTKWGL
ncbi:RES domain-containing protein [Acerihabitans sp. TG2]|uniref:RES domain-containing protein n=1 Tax=Acerihabitans sp. TG2 TaxID=3096008 RepID=UPI002B239C19|nr:RES domain-containing protein [Acerihabitans sp. TG2]MEA9393228.1 RES domain-containing protein [Acerihabitans sp. TG2]